MDIKLRGITLSFILWYVLPGLNFLVINVLFPLAILSPDAFSNYSSLGNLVVLAGAALVVGFVMDSLKLYQFTIGYAQKRKSFFTELGERLSVAPEMARDIFNYIRELAGEDGSRYEYLSLEHSRWVMINHTSKCFYLLSVTWCIVLLIHQISPEIPSYMSLSIYDQRVVLALDSLIALIALGVGIRLSRISSDHLAISNNGYLYLAASNSVSIREWIQLSDAQKASTRISSKQEKGSGSEN